MTRKITALIGAQYGSEGKGVVAKKLANDYEIHVRVGAPNAGHSFVHMGKIWKMQAVPCGWVNPDALLCIGPGALVNLDILENELFSIYEVDPTIVNRIKIDRRAGVLERRHHEMEGGVDGEIHRRIGSTGEGVGAARLDQIRRIQGSFLQMKDVPESYQLAGLPLESYLTDSVPELLGDAYTGGLSIMLEGTQGHGLSLNHGSWPHVTSSDTGAARLCADAGVPPRRLTDVVAVVRTHPIRVAGPSGPLRGETTWERMSEKLGRTVREQTTVTNKDRRIAEWDAQVVKDCFTINAPTSVALTFLDYLSPDDHCITDFSMLSESGKGFVDYVERFFGAPVDFVGTGFDEDHGWYSIDRRG